MNSLILAALYTLPHMRFDRLLKKLGEQHGVWVVQHADAVRALRSQGGRLGEMIAEFVESGQMVPDALLCQALKEYTKSDLEKRNVLLLGFPRTTRQLEMMLSDELSPRCWIHVHLSDWKYEQFRSLEQYCEACAHVHLSQQNGRCSNCNSKMDLAERDMNSMHLSMEHWRCGTAPLFDYLKARGRLREVDGDAPDEDVLAELKAILGFS